jgi:Bacterial SH3 domain
MRSSVLRMSDHKLRAPPTALGEWLAAELPSRSAISKPNIAGPEPESGGNDEAGLPVSEPRAAPPKGPPRPIKGLISALVGVALVLTAILSFLLWQGTLGPRADGAMVPADGLSAASTPSSTGLAQPVQGSTAPEIALSSPDRIEAKAGEEIDFPIAIDATEKLPSRCVIAVSAMPDGASFSEGRPYGATGWSLRPDEIGELRLRLPEARSGASDMRIELLAADGAVLAQSETRLTIAADPAEAETVSAVESSPSEQIARAEAPKSVETVPPPPQPKPAPSAKTEPSVKVATVKVVTIKPPGPTRPHDGAFALGEAAEARAEWVEIVRPVDMHARPQKSSETVKVAKKGLKLRVTARNKDWVQVSDPATSANGWIYSRFLKPTEPPAQ